MNSSTLPGSVAGETSRRDFVKKSLAACASAAVVGRAPLLPAAKASAIATPPVATGRARNVVFIVADQLRADCVGCYGNSIVRTPHLDRLARDGARFDAAFCQHPQCAPSRASFMTGRYPHITGCISNYVAMNPAELTLGEYLRQNGFATSAFGKSHLFEQKTRAGFAFTALCGGQNSERKDAETMGEPDNFANAYKPWLKANGHWESMVRMCKNRESREYRESFQAIPSPMSPQAYFDGWVGNQAVSELEKMPADRPFFMWVSFPNPHNPFEPPEPYASMYRPDDMPLPETFPGDLAGKPPHQLGYKRQGRGVYNYENLTAEKLRKVIAYYYASITLVDDQVGKILDVLDRRNLRGDTLVVFTSDHGEFLGHHGLLLKSTDDYPMLYDKGLHVPLICSHPGGVKKREINVPVELVDLFPTITEALGLPVPPEVQGASFLQSLISHAAPSTKEYIFAETGAVKMIRGATHKLVYYPGQPYGELYNIVEDPLEKKNLYDDRSRASTRAELTRALLDRLVFSEAAFHGESNRGRAYWRKTYTAPFVQRPSSL